MTKQQQRKTAKAWQVLLALGDPGVPDRGLGLALRVAPAELVAECAVQCGYTEQLTVLLSGSHRLRQHIICTWPSENAILRPWSAEKQQAIDMALALEAEMTARRAVRELGL